MHDQVSDPGGILNTRRIAFRITAFRTVQNRRLSPLPKEGIILSDHNYTYFGAQYWPCILDPPGFGLPLPGLPSGFTTVLPAEL